MVVGETGVVAQLDRVLHSETFRNSEALRRLLKFLAEKSFAGAADQLKEYSVGIEALGKPPSYDPRQDSIVRIQMGRLRQKLAEYYRTEGVEDSIVLDIPKGHFRLEWTSREAVPAEEIIPPPAAPAPAVPGKNRTTVALAVALGLALVWAGFATAQLLRERGTPSLSALTPEQKELWSPFLTSNRPTVISVSAPLFVGIQGFGLYRDLSLNNWPDVEKSDRVEAIRKALNAPAISPRYNYAAMGLLDAVFHLGKFLGKTGADVPLAPSTRFSWQQLADNNTILVGSSRVFSEQVRALPVDLRLVFQENGIRDLNPAAGAPALMLDAFPPITGDSSGQMDSGELYALVTDAPGPLGSSRIRSFNANHSPGTLGAMQAFTNPAWAKSIVEKLRKPSGEIPPYFQLVLKVKYKDAVPTEISYVLHHELKPTRTPQSPAQK